jgi:hypothetical protein
MKKRSNTHPCTSKALHTIGIYGGKEEFSHIIGILSKMFFLKDSRASRKKYFFSKLTRLQQQASIDEFMHQWEALATRVFGLSNDQLLQYYIGGLKPHIQDELRLHEVTTV